MIKTILVCLDHSERALGVFEKASEIADAFDARMILFHAVAVPQEFPAAAHSVTGDPLPDVLLRAAADDLRRLAQSNPRATIQAPVASSGQPWRAILATADQLEPDLIILGSHGYHGFDRLLGTTAGSVANQSTRDVLIVHEPRRGQP